MANKRVLFLCAHNQSRSVTAEGLLKGEKGYDVRSRALWKGFARRATKWDGQWATDVYVMMPGMSKVAEEIGIPKKKIHTLFVPDTFVACEDSLLTTLKDQLAYHGIQIRKSMARAKNDCYDVYEKKMGFSSRMWEAGSKDFLIPSERGFRYVELGRAPSGEEESQWEEPAEESWEEAFARGKRDAERMRAQEAGDFDYVPMWHIQEGERRMQEAERAESEMLERARRLWGDKKQRRLF